MGQRILIVDDEPSIVASLEFLMKREGFEVESAADAATALAAAARRAPALVLLDVVLPDRSGLEVLAALRGDPRLGELKVILLTALGGDGDRQRGLAAGADRYLTKPFSTKELVGEVRRLLTPA